MGSNFHYSIDLNEDQTHHEEPFFYPIGSSSSLLHNHQVLSNSSASSSSILSLSSYLPFLINSQEDQHVAYNNTYHADHFHLSQLLKAKMLNGGSSSPYDHMVPKKETRLKLTIRKKDHHDDQTDFLHQNPTKPNSDSDKWMMSPKMRLIKNAITNNKQSTDHASNNNNDHKEDHHTLNQKTSFGKDHDDDRKKVSPSTTTDVTMENRYDTITENGYSNNNGVIRVCSDCNTIKTPLWRSGPRGPKSLCNACGIRQRKARRAAMAAATATGNQEVVAARMQHLPVKKKLQNKKKRSNGGDKYNITLAVVANTKKCKINEGDEDAATVGGDSEISKSTTSSDSSVSSNKLRFDDLAIMLRKSSAYQQVFPQEEKEAAVLLMALSYGMVHG
ncbi:GATA transcription factor 21 [Hirschfeldia incana]|nr:GATA transcription factor 21 [Hirschfeldia incana]